MARVSVFLLSIFRALLSSLSAYIFIYSHILCFSVLSLFHCYCSRFFLEFQINVHIGGEIQLCHNFLTLTFLWPWPHHSLFYNWLSLQDCSRYFFNQISNKDMYRYERNLMGTCDIQSCSLDQLVFISKIIYMYCMCTMNYN